MKIKHFRINEDLDRSLIDFCNELALPDGYVIRQALINFFKDDWTRANILALEDQPLPKQRQAKHASNEPH